MIVAAFLVTDKTNQVRFFEKIFLVANISPEVVFGMLFDIGAQKIDGIILNTNEMVIAAFLVTNKAN